MSILSLIAEVGISTKRVKQGGVEYCSECPSCGGSDRFIIWPKQGGVGRYWCRQCSAQGDAIQFCRDFLSLSFKEACEKVGRRPTEQGKEALFIKRSAFKPKDLTLPSKDWQLEMEKVVQQANDRLLENPSLLDSDKPRGLSKDVIKRFKIGWNEESQYLSLDCNSLGMVGKQTILCPTGVFIPVYRGDDLSMVKIRRAEGANPRYCSKYHIIKGSRAVSAIYGNEKLPLVIVESELDAVLLQAKAGSFCCSVSLGGVAMKPDRYLHNLITRASLVLLALDNDDPARNHLRFWARTYPKAKVWPTPIGKSPGDAYLLGLDILKWVIEGLIR